MSNSRETFELIDQYLKGNLTGQEKLAFEKQMKEEPGLSEEVAMQKLLNDLLLEKGLADIRKKVGEDISGTAPSPVKKIILLSVGLLLLTAGTIFFYFENDKEEKVLVISSKEIQEIKTSPTIIIQDRKNPKQADTHEYKRNKRISPSPNDHQTSIKEDLREERKEKSTEYKEEAVQEEESVPIIENKAQPLPCPEIVFDIHSEASCLNKQTGSIQIVLSSIKGGQKPYLYSIAGKDFSLESVNSKLSKGDYTIAIKDHKGCTAKQSVHISEKACREYKDYSFHPETETWKFPFQENESGTITISDKSGRVVYRTKVMSGSPYEWNGTATNGEMLKTDTYLYIAESDNGEIRQGYITILH